MTDYSRPTPDELEASWRETLPHRRFKLRVDTIADVPVLAVVCACGRAHPFLHGLDSGTLARWLADHDDEMFLTDDQVRSLHEARIDRAEPARPRDLPPFTPDPRLTLRTGI